MKTTNLKARTRTGMGRRACHKLRRAGEIPANLYGSEQVDGKTVTRNVNLAVSAYDIDLILKQHVTVLSVNHDGKTELCQLTEVQRDAFGSSVMHVDLLAIDKNKEMHGMVDILVKGEAKGVKSGGLLRVALRSLDVRALPANMPRDITVVVDDLDINDSLHVGELTLPEGVTAITDAHQMIVQVIHPAGDEDEDEVEADAGEGSNEPDVIAKGKKEEE